MKPFTLHLSVCPANHGEPCTCGADSSRTEAEFRQQRAPSRWPVQKVRNNRITRADLPPNPRVGDTLLFVNDAPTRQTIPLWLVILAIAGVLAVFWLGAFWARP